MMTSTRWLLHKSNTGAVDPDHPDTRLNVGLLEGWVSVVMNTTLFVVKLVLGLMTGSVSLQADAVHTIGDSLTSVVVIFGFKMARKPADKEHPFGHGRMESVAAVAIGVLLAVVAFEMGQAAVNRLLHPLPLHAPVWVLVVLVVTLFMKEWLSRFAIDLGKLIRSQVLTADAWHHRSDVFATGMVVLAFIAARFGVTRLDGIMGLGVSLMIAWVAWETVRGAIGPILGEKAPDEMYQEIDAIARETKGVQDVHDILIQRYGGTSIVSLHIEVPSTGTALETHELTHVIEQRIAQRFPGHAIVHVDPVDRAHVHYAEVETLLRQAMAEIGGVTSYHDLRIEGGAEQFTAVMDVTTPSGRDDEAMQKLRRALGDRLREKFPEARVAVDVEPPYFHTVTKPKTEGGNQKAG